MKKPFIRCDTCNKEFSGPEPFAQHLVSKAHMKEVQKQGTTQVPSLQTPTSTSTDQKQVPTFQTPLPTANGQKYRCDVCQVDFSGPTPTQQHMNGSKHKSMLNKLRILQENPIDVTTYQQQGAQLQCQICEKCFSGPESYEDHIRSKKHQRKVEIANMKERLTMQEPASCPPAPDSPVEQMQASLYPRLPHATAVIPCRAMAEIAPKKKTTGCMAAFKSLVKKKKTHN